MSKVLKFIVHFVVICTLICVLGLVLPPFFGVRTVIVDKSDKATEPPGRICYICDSGEEFCDQRRYSDTCTERFRDI